MERIHPKPVTPLEDLERRNRELLFVNVRDRIQEALDLADRIESGDATAAEQRQGLVMALRGLARVARYLTE